MSEITGASNYFGGQSKKMNKKGNKIRIKYNYNQMHETTNYQIIGNIITSETRISSAERKVSATSREPYHVRSEMDSHADTAVSGKNFEVLRYTNRI